PASGNASAPIVIRSYPGERAILDGSYGMAFTWSPSGDDWTTTVGVADPHMVSVDDHRLYRYKDCATFDAFTWGPGVCASGTTVKVHLPDGSSPNLHTMRISKRNTAFFVSGQSYVYFVDLTFQNYGCGANAKAIYLNDASDNLVQGCTFYNDDVGVGLKRAS